MRGESFERLIIIGAAVILAAIVLFLAWIFNRGLGKDRKSLWGEIWQIEKFLLVFVAAVLSVLGILQIINFVLVSIDKQGVKIPSANGAVWLMIITSIVSMLALIGAAGTITWFKNRGTNKS